MAQELQPVHLGHAQILDDQIDRLLPDHVQSDAAVIGGHDIVALALEDDLQKPLNRLLVIQHQDALAGSGRSGGAGARWDR